MTGTLSRLLTEEPAGRRSGTGRASASDGNGLGLLPIAADLLPRDSAAARRGRAGRLITFALVVIAVLGVGAAYLVTAHATSSATSALHAAQDRQTSLQQQQKAYTNLTATQALTTRLQGQLATLMAADLPWSQLLPALGGLRGVIEFTSVSGTLTDPAKTVTPAAATPVDAAAVGTLVITGTADDKPTIAAFVDALGSTAGLANPFVSAVTQAADGAAFTFTVQVDITSAVHATAATRWAPTAGGGK